MSGFKSFLKKTIKTISGYDIQGCGSGGFALASKEMEMQFLDPASIVLMQKTDDEVQATRGIYDYLRRLRIKTLLDKYQINTVIDVGANRGQFATELRRIGYQGRIISFEPISSAFASLKAAAQNDSNWQIHNLALGKQNGQQKIHIAQMSVFTSFLKSNEWCEQQFGKDSVGTQEETVTVRRLDEVLRETVDNLDKARMYLKMDTQGYDLEVFRGLGNAYDRVFALQSEISAIPIYQGMPHLTESISVFEQAGFELAGMYPVTHDKSTLAAVEFDCLMINAQLNKSLPTL